MQFSIVAVAAALASVVAAASNGTVVYTTVVDYETTTYCPAPTTLTYGSTTITVTSTGIVTIPCPCTKSYQVTVTPVVYCNTCSTKPAYVNTTVAVTTVPVVATTTAAKPSTYTGAANKAVAGSAAGLAGLLGLAAYIL